MTPEMKKDVDRMAEQLALQGVKLKRVGDTLSLVVNDPCAKLDAIRLACDWLDRFGEIHGAPEHAPTVVVDDDDPPAASTSTTI